ncbi:MAG: hypothetical protein R3275_09335 [Saprospiraceae bacterium]|nr:hypothetical protein [Saprospiraceae bacterium]
MKRILSLVLCLFSLIMLKAEGTRELAPNNNITINGNVTTDIAALNLNHPSYQSFASYDNPNTTSRLHIHIADPANEGIYLGFSNGTLNFTGQNAPIVSFEYRILDPNGNIVYGPSIITPANANTPTWQTAYNGPAPLYPGGYTPFIVSPSDLTSQGWTTTGDYYIEFRELENDNRFLINYWDITVFDGSTGTPVEKKGRIWSENWAFFAINDYGFPNRPFNGAFYVCAEDPTNPEAAFITKVNFNGSGFRPAAFNVAFNSFGTANTGMITEDRKSMQNVNATTPEYQIFLNDPVDLCESATGGNLEITGIGRCSESDYCIQYTASQPGQVDILLDFDGNDGIYTANTTDVLFVLNIDSSRVNKPICLDWNGKDGLGNSISAMGNSQIPVVVSYAQGIYHFPIYDAELLTDGLNIEAVRPAGPSPKLFYDDSNISAPSGSGEPDVQLAGCTLPCHRWTNYTQPDIVGFGNLNTINSWWFSQQLVESYLFDLPVYLECSLEGPQAICPGETAQVKFTPEYFPASGRHPAILQKDWSGPGIVGPRDTDSIEIDQPGQYGLKILWENSIGDTCFTSCIIQIEEKEETTIRIDTLLLRGDTATIFDEKYFEGGTFKNVFPGNQECDTNVIIHVRIIETALHYDFNDCWSVNADSTSMDYREFKPTYPDPMTCADVTAEYLRRENPMVNKHSCTPGVNGSPAMCISSLDNCDYLPGNDKSVVFEVTVNPAADTAVAVTGLCFFERAPEMYDWINGPKGPNNYPTLYGIRVLKDGQEIYSQSDIPTSTDWTKEIFDFKGNRDFIAKEETVFRFELLGYCLAGDTSKVTAWDLDELSVMASCVSPAAALPNITGKATTIYGTAITGADVILYPENHSFDQRNEVTGQGGSFSFTHVPENQIYTIDCQKSDDPLNGVSTKDVIYLLRHLLGKNELDDPYKILAGDVDDNRVISASDLIQIRKLILGKISKFNNTPSWRIGRFESEPSIANPWTFEDQVHIEVKDEHISDLNLTGFKVGDVTDDAVSGSRVQQIRHEKRSILYYEQQITEDGQSIVSFYLPEAEQVMGLQLGIDLQNSSFVSLHSDRMNIGMEDFYINDAGILRLSLPLNDPVTLQSQSPVIEIVLDRPLTGIELETGFNNEVYIGLEIESRPLSLLQKETYEYSEETTDLKIYPNPFKDRLNVEFLPVAPQNFELEIYSLEGRKLYGGSRIWNSNSTNITVDLNNMDLGGHSALIYRIRSDNRTWQGILMRVTE